MRGVTDEDYGPIPAGTAYAASDPRLGLWVLASLADSALVYHERIFGSLDAADRERYWSEYRRVGELFGLPDDAMPTTLADLREYLDGRLTDGSLWIDDERREAAKRMVLSPPFEGLRRAAVMPVHETIKLVSVGLLPARSASSSASPGTRPARRSCARPSSNCASAPASGPPPSASTQPPATTPASSTAPSPPSTPPPPPPGRLGSGTFLLSRRRVGEWRGPSR